MPTLAFAPSAYDHLLAISRNAIAHGHETQCYLVGRPTTDGAMVEVVLHPGSPTEESAMTRGDHGAAGKALYPFIKRGKKLLGEAHVHPMDLVGPSLGDFQTLRRIAGQYPGYLCVVVTPHSDKTDLVVTAHSITDDHVLEHTITIADPAPFALPEPAAYDATIDGRDQHVLILGLGSGACTVALQVATWGVDRLTLVDPDRFEERNRTRHLADPRAIGKYKATWMAGFLRKRTKTKITASTLAITPSTRNELATLVETATIVVNGTGDPVVSLLVSEAAMNARVPVIHAGVFARGSGGFVFRQDTTPESPCYACLFGITRATTNDTATTLDALTQHYGYTPEELAGHLGLWTDVNVTSAVHAKVTMDTLRHRYTVESPNFYRISNDTLRLQTATIRQRPDCPNHAHSA